MLGKRTLTLVLIAKCTANSRGLLGPPQLHVRGSNDTHAGRVFKEVDILLSR